MKRLLLASLATGALAFAAPAFAQTTDPVPSPPPVEQPEAAPEGMPPAGEMAAAPEASPAPDAELAATPEANPAPDAELAAAPPAQEPLSSDASPTAALASAQAICQPRVTSVHFGQRGSALTQENRNAIEYAVDAASVCNLEQVTITDSSDGRIADRRAETLRATLIDRGVPEDRIVVAEETTAEGAATGQVDLRMTFAGVASSETPVASLEGAETPTGS